MGFQADIGDINNAGDVVFVATTSDTVTTTSGVFLATGGEIQVTAVEGQAAPGGGTFGGTYGSPRINEWGNVLFTALVPESVVFLWSGGVLSRVASPGDTFAGDPAFVFGSFQALGLNNSGLWAVSANTSGAALRGIFVSGGLPIRPSVPALGHAGIAVLVAAIGLFGVAGLRRCSGNA